MIKKATYNCLVTTPMFLKGVDKNKPEFRAPSLKGVLRYWWRAINGHLQLNELLEQEGLIFGSAGEAGRSSFNLRIDTVDLQTHKTSPLPHKDRFQLRCISPGSRFDIITSMRKEVVYKGNIIFDQQRLESLILIVSALGGLGQRSRRGMGCFMIQGLNLEPDYLGSISLRLNQFNDYFDRINLSIITKFENKSNPYPYIREVKVGRSEPGETLLRRVSNETHNLNRKYSWDYAASVYSGPL